MLMEYQHLMAALRIIESARLECGAEYGYGNNPAWSKLYRIGRYLNAQAENLLKELDHE